MIETCRQCGCPKIRGQCMECPVGGWSWTIGFTLALVILFVMKGCSAHGQDRPALTVRERHDIAACLVAEAGPGPDYPAILSVLSHRSSSLAWSARHYCAIWVAERPSMRQSAIRLLPNGPSARLYRYHWRMANEAIDAWLAGERPACEANYFGDHHGDARRARRAGWSRVDCGRTQNAFWLSGPRGGRAVRADLARGRGR